MMQIAQYLKERKRWDLMFKIRDHAKRQMDDNEILESWINLQYDSLNQTLCYDKTEYDDKTVKRQLNKFKLDRPRTWKIHDICQYGGLDGETFLMIHSIDQPLLLSLILHVFRKYPPHNVFLFEQDIINKHFTSMSRWGAELNRHEIHSDIVKAILLYPVCYTESTDIIGPDRIKAVFYVQTIGNEYNERLGHHRRFYELKIDSMSNLLERSNLLCRQSSSLIDDLLESCKDINNIVGCY